MSDKFVRKTGSDAAAGTSAATAWLTLAKALGASGIASGDTVYVGAGIYNECVTVAMTSATAETKIIGDVDGAKTGDAGAVVWTGYDSGLTTTPGNVVTLNLDGRDYLTFEKIALFQGGSGNGVIDGTTTTGSTNITFRDCQIAATRDDCTLIRITNTSGGQALAWLFDRCIIVALAFTTYSISAQLHTSDYDLNVKWQNCLHLGGRSEFLYASTTGSGSGKPGGIRAISCTFHSGGRVWEFAGTWSTSTPSQFYHNITLGVNYPLQAANTGEIVENYNLFDTAYGNVNVTAGANSIAGAPPASLPLLSYGYEWLVGMIPQPPTTPLTVSAPLAFAPISASPAPTTTDGMGRPRPAGLADVDVAIGWMDRHDVAVLSSAANADGGTGAAWEQTGAMDDDILIPVTATATVITIRVITSGHSGTNYPQAELLANAAIGVTGATQTAGSAVTSYTTLTFSSFTPSAAGIIRVRLKNRTANATGIVRWDSLGAA